MDELETYIEIGKLVTTVIAVVAAIWAFHKWRSRDELFPRVFFEVSVNFVGKSEDGIVCELVALIENKGIVPLKLKDMTFTVRGLFETDRLEKGSEKIRGQVNFHRELARGLFVPEDWEYTFIYPGVRTEYNYVTTIPIETAFLRMQGDFNYIEPGRSHHAAKVLAVPKFER